jgi:hypothetical protein
MITVEKITDTTILGLPKPARMKFARAKTGNSHIRIL